MASQTVTAQKMKFSIKGFLSKCDQIRGFLRIWSHFLKKSLMKNFIFCAVVYAVLWDPEELGEGWASLEILPPLS